MTKSDIRKKIWFIHEVLKRAFLSTFWIFTGNLLLIENDSTKCLWISCENSKNPVLGIFIHKVMIFAKNDFFGSEVSKWSNSKSYHVRSEIWRPSIFLLPGHPGSTLRKIFDFFFRFFGPTLPFGGSYVTSSVRPSVRPSRKVLILPTIRFFWYFASS